MLQQAIAITDFLYLIFKYIFRGTNEKVYFSKLPHLHKVGYLLQSCFGDGFKFDTSDSLTFAKQKREDSGLSRSDTSRAFCDMPVITETVFSELELLGHVQDIEEHEPNKHKLKGH